MAISLGVPFGTGIWGEPDLALPTRGGLGEPVNVSLETAGGSRLGTISVPGTAAEVLSLPGPSSFVDRLFGGFVRFSSFSDVDDRGVERGLDVRGVEFFDHFDTGAAVFGDLIDVSTFHQP